MQGESAKYITHIAQFPIQETEMSKLRTFLTPDFTIHWSKRDVHPLMLISPYFNSRESKATADEPEFM